MMMMMNDDIYPVLRYMCARKLKTWSNSASETLTGDQTLPGKVTVELDPSSGASALTLTDVNETN